ncbi:MAG: hypothetical protein QM571_02950 [Micrococcaceae bacterium]
MLNHLKSLGAVTDLKPNFSADVPGLSWLHDFIGAIQAFGIYIGVIGFILAAALFGFGRATNSGGHQQKGAGAMGIALLVIVLIASAGSIVVWAVAQKL